MAKRQIETINPELLAAQKYRAKCRFRAIARLARANAYWLMEHDEDEYEGDDVMKKVQSDVRAKTRKQLLRLKDKAILNKPAEDRTEAEKHYLYRIIGGLRCFKIYPKNVKMKLAGVTYFKYYGPNRVIVRQDQEAQGLYFVVTGDIIISQMEYDGVLQRYDSVDIGVLKPSDMIGEGSLLHNIPRTATCTTLGHCELLVVYKKDFKNVLQACVQQQWDNIGQIMSAFTYFQKLDEVSLREGSVLGKQKQFEANETILGDGVGVPNFVYFVISGRCQMIESLQVAVEKRLGQEYYKLYEPAGLKEKEDSDSDLDVKYFGLYKKVSEINIPSSLEQIPRSQSVVRIKPERESEICAVDGKQSGKLFSSRLSIRLPSDPWPPNVKMYFVQVCEFIQGSSFGFNENMKDRRIVASTPVLCLILPKIWLMSRNTANIWTRIEHYMKKHIPDKRQLFELFVKERRWEQFKDGVVMDVVSRSSAVNATLHDVPYSVRMQEMHQ